MIIRKRRSAMTLLLILAICLSASSVVSASRLPVATSANYWTRRASRLDRNSATRNTKEGKSRINQALRTTDRRLLGTAAIAVSAGGLMQSSDSIGRALYFWTRAGPIVAHYRFTQWWLRNSEKEHRNKVYGKLHDRYCEPSLKIILHLQGLFTKIGQVLSARPDFVPTQYVELFATVQDDIPQWPYEDVEELVHKSLKENQGLEWDDVFESMDPIALGCASIGQCHKAVLKSPWDDKYDGGETVAVKIMHPDAENRFEHDFQIFRWLCRIALPGWKPILNEFQTQLMTEFDYKVEAQNLEEVRGNMMASPYANKVTVPQPLHELCSKNMLVMEMLKGKKFGDAVEDRLSDALGGNPEAAKDILRKKRTALVIGEGSDGTAAEMIAHGKALLEQEGKTSLLSRLSMGYRLFSLHRHVNSCIQLMMDVHGHQVFVNRIFNGDCHPGNLMELSDGKIGLIDYGQTKRLSKDESLSIARVVSELGEPTIDETKVAVAMRQLGFETKYDKDNVLTKYAKLFFDSDDDSKAEGCATPQLYLLKLSTMDPLLTVPDAAVFTARMSFLFRGMGAMAGDPVHTSKYWKRLADEALAADLKN